MKFVQSIRFRIVFACVIFALLVSAVVGYLSVWSIKFNADEQFNWHIEKEMSHLITLYHQGYNMTQGTTRGKVIVGKDSLVIEELAKQILAKTSTQTPTSLDELSIKWHPRTMQNGYFNYQYNDKNQSIFILKAPLNTHINLYYIIDITGFNQIKNHGAKITFEYLFQSILIILILAVIIGFYLTKKAISPLSNLAKNIDNINSAKYYDDEIGYLAQTIHSHTQRLTEFIQREKAFSKDASHELRTPVAVTQAALDVAFALKEERSPKMVKILHRIQRANKQMTQLIETFLILGKETPEKMPQENINLKKFIQASVKKNTYLIENKDIQCEISVPDDLTATLSKQYFGIILDNLIRNSFQYTQEGKVRIQASQHQVIISDTGIGFHSSKEINEKGYGLGLRIIERICTLQEWNIEIKRSDQDGTIISISF